MNPPRKSGPFSLFDWGKREEAFRQLVEETRERLYWTVRRMVGREAIAEEILQEAYMAYWELGRTRAPRNPAGWLRRVCTNRAIDYLRRERNRSGPSSLPEPDQLSSGENIEATALAGETEAILDRALSLLPPQQRAAFVLRVIEELDYKEISSILKVSPSTVRNHVMAARRKLEAILRSGGIEL